MTKLVDAPIVLRKTPYVLVTGGAGFIGANLADRLARHRRNVLIFDCLARDHVVDNLDWLSRRHGGRIGVATADVRDFESVREAVRRYPGILPRCAGGGHLQHRRSDHRLRRQCARHAERAGGDPRLRAEPPPLVFTSTNKVYGVACAVGDLRQDGRRYRPRRPALSDGFTEAQPLDLHSPYGCSKERRTNTFWIMHVSSAFPPSSFG